MARKSLLEDLAQPFAELPPLAGVIATALLVLLGWAAPMVPAATAIALIALQFGRWFAWLAAVFVLGYTLIGVWRRLGDRRRFDATDDPASLTWSQFERFIAEFYRRRGASVTVRGGSTSDGGVDLTVTYPAGEHWIVQCKHWKKRRVGVGPLRELWGVLSDEKADGAVFITSGSFSPDAELFARGKRFELIDGPKLQGMISEVKRSQTSGESAPSGQDAVPRCPRCGSEMVMRTARRGARAGEQFWGCSTYPTCTGVRAAVPAGQA